MRRPRLLLAFFISAASCFFSTLAAVPVMERLSRGVVAVPQPDGKVFVSWRLLADDPVGVGFNLYRTTAPGPARPGAPGEPAANREQGPVMAKLNAIF